MSGLIRITGATVATMEPDDKLLEGTDVWVKDGRILALLPSSAKPPAAGPVETLSMPGGVVMPGMVNAHSHSSSSFNRGMIPGAPLDIFVMESMARRAPRTLRSAYLSAAIQAIEMLKGGVTATVDHFRFGAVPTLEATSAVFQAYEDIGIRAAVAPMFEDKLYLDSLPLDRAALPPVIAERWAAMRLPSVDDYFALMAGLVKKWSGHDRLSVLLGVDGPQRCTRELLERTGAFATEHKIGLHTHLLEAKTQALMAPAEFGGSFVEYLASFGLMNPRSSLAHFVWCTERDIELAAETGVNVVHNPASNLVLGSGIQPAARLLAKGVHVALGSDGSSSGPASLFEQVKLATMLSHITETDPNRWINGAQALRMATAGGARVLVQDGDLGVIRPGARADLAILDLKKSLHRPRGELFNHLAQFETGANVDTVLVGGEIVLRYGQLTRVDEEALQAEADAVALAEREANLPFLAATRAERPVFEPMIVAALDSPLPINRFASLP